ncbi:acyltransferase [Pedobacter nutrimenti]|uniref:acyltransferase n=1 Tax=Pedobacter nutrimenti TaxID=1241337 RepID=UPI002931DFE6|nr:acyltransferase [Pedobacter nutrimenti]
MTEVLKNQRKVTFIQKLKTWILKNKYGDQLRTNGAIRILGDLPVFKLPGTSSITLGEKVVLNSDADNSNTALTFRCTLACGLNGVIEIGDNTMMNGVSVTAYQRVKVGKNCQIASCTFISDTDFHPVNPVIREREALGYKIDHTEVNKKEVIIGDNVWIGWGCIILKGVTIGENSIIAAGSVVLRDIPSNVVAGGNPAIVKKHL